MNPLESIPSHPLVVPVAVFGFLACLWVLAVTYFARGMRSRRVGNANERVLRTWIDGVETEVRLPMSGVSSLGQEGASSRANRFSRAFVLQATMAFGVTFVVAILWSKSLLVAGGAIAVLATALVMVMQYRASKRRDLLEMQSVESLRFANRSLRAGHPVSGMIQVLADRVQSPTGDMFVEIVQRERMGESLESAIRGTLLKAERQEMRAFGTTLLVHIETGGNLPSSIDRICSSIVERTMLRKHARALTAEARFSAQFVMVAPIAFVLFFAANSERYSEFLFGDPLGRLMLMGAVLLILAGLIAVNRVSQLNVGTGEVRS